MELIIQVFMQTFSMMKTKKGVLGSTKDIYICNTGNSCDIDIRRLLKVILLLIGLKFVPLIMH